MSQKVRDRDDPAVAAAAALIRGRRTINLFEPAPVGSEVLRDAIELARWAPNHKLTEPWRFYILGVETAARVAECWAGFEAETKGERAGAARLKRLEGIPGNFVLTSPRSEDPVLEREDYAACCCAAQNLMLYLWQRGVGAKWTTGGITRQSRLYDLLGIDETRECIVGYFWYGMPKVVPEQNRRELAEILTELP